MNGTEVLYAPAARRRVVPLLVATLAILLLAGLLSPAPATAQVGTRTARATLKPVPSPGGNTGVRGTINFTDDGNLLSYSGTSSGMAALSQYVSLVYGRNSHAKLTATNPPPCADDGTLGSPVDATARMFLGMWAPAVGTTRVLTGSNALVGLEEVNTASIRRVNVPTWTPDLMRDIRPQTFLLQACGLITRK